ncbi:MAG TPA: hypothetical protein VF658_17380 [Pyrinomonadaceae bacterium]|jgi:hypothetical protein
MNCQTFEPTVNDLARGQMMEATERESALAHAEECERCGARLADERALSFGLRAFASSVENSNAPAQVETALRAAFRQRNDVKLAPVVAVATARRGRWTVWATAAAAAVLTVIALQAFRLRETPAPLQRASETANVSSPKETALAPVEAKQPDAPSRIDDRVASQPTISPRTINRPPFSANYTTASNQAVRRPRAAQASQAEAEIMTDFMPLTYGAAMSPNEGGQLVRVELPRSALATLGLPMNVDNAQERVKADVLLGHDGLARAIRFVR